jgi:hypothetical protein
MHPIQRTEGVDVLSGKGDADNIAGLANLFVAQNAEGLIFPRFGLSAHGLQIVVLFALLNFGQ